MGRDRWAPARYEVGLPLFLDERAQEEPIPHTRRRWIRRLPSLEATARFIQAGSGARRPRC